MDWYYGIIEDRNDPLKIGRVRVRVHGCHTDDKNKIGSPDLPWSHVIMPVTNAGLGGFGIQHSLVEGTTVFGFWRDEDMQDFVVMGVQQGISQKGYKETITDELIDNQVDKGFNDPRRKTSDEYLSTADGLNPPGDAKRGNSLTAALDSAPNIIKKTNITYGGAGSKREEFTEADKTLPYYPLVTDATDINVFATATGDYSSRDLSEFIKDKETTISYLEAASGNPDVSDYKAAVRKDKKVTGAKSNATPLYPYNKALYTESGHIVELDDTRGNERISIEHRTGTFYEIDAEGNQIHRVVNDNYTVICKDNELYVGGNVNIVVKGDANITATKKVNIKGYNDGKIDVSGNLEIRAGENLTLKSGKDVIVQAQKFRPNS
jgi:hypothetical protein